MHEAFNHLAAEPLTLPEVQAHIHTAFFQHAYTYPHNRFYHLIQNYRARQYLSRLNAKRIRTYVAESGTDLRPYKVIQLSQWVRRLRPRTIVEFGAGASTVLFAELLEKYGIDGKVISLEQNTDYYDRITKAMPDALKHRVEIHLCPITYTRMYDGFRCLSYELPDMPSHIDFAYIDGPDPQWTTSPVPFFNGDLCNLANKGLTVDFAVNDGRWFNLHLYRTHLRSTYRFKPTVKYKSFMIENRSIQPSSWSFARFVR